MKHIYEKLTNELETKNSTQPEDKSMTFFHISFFAFTAILFLSIMINDSQIYFYKNYLLSSVVGLGIYLIIFFYLLPKYHRSKVYRMPYYLAIFLLGISVSFYIVPKIYHYHFLKKENVCIEAKITYKYYSYTSGEVGRISFDTKYEPTKPIELMRLGSLSAIPKEEYNKLPPINSNIEICGEISKVGFTYSYFEAGK